MLIELLFAFGIVAVCVVIHTIGLMLLFEWLIKSRFAIRTRLRRDHYSFLLIGVFGFITILHIGETGIWAGFYYWQELFQDYETSLYFSLGSYTTIGYGDVVLPQKWRLVGGIEGISGVLLCGLSTACIFAVVNAIFQIRIRPAGTMTSPPWR